MSTVNNDHSTVARAQLVVMQTQQLSYRSALAAMQSCASRNDVDLLSVALLVNATLTLPPDPDGRFGTDVFRAGSRSAVVGNLDALSQMSRAQGVLMQRDGLTSQEALHDIHACADRLGIDASVVADVLVETVVPTRRRFDSD